MAAWLFGEVRNIGRQMKMQKDSRIFVAGHKGLVGSAISRELQNQGFNRVIERTRSELDLLDAKAVSNFYEEQQPEEVTIMIHRRAPMIRHGFIAGVTPQLLRRELATCI